MRTSKFIECCLFTDFDVIDDFLESFDVDMTQDDVNEALERCCGRYKGFGIIILEIMWGKVIDYYRGVLDANKFDCDCSSPSYPHFYYDGMEITSKGDLDEIAGIE